MELEVEIPVKGTIVGSDSAALDLSGQVPHDRESEQSFQPCALGKGKKRRFREVENGNTVITRQWLLGERFKEVCKVLCCKIARTG